MAVALTFGLALAGCSQPTDDPGDTKTPTVTSITVSPNPASVAKGGTQNFTAQVLGTNNPGQGVTWTLEGDPTDSSINSSSGILSIDVSEGKTSLTVRATSTVDTSKSGTASVSITPDSLPQYNGGNPALNVNTIGAIYAANGGDTRISYLSSANATVASRDVMLPDLVNQADALYAFFDSASSSYSTKSAVFTALAGYELSMRDFGCWR